MSITSDILKYLLSFFQAKDIISLSQTSKINNFIMSKLLREDNTSSLRLGIYYPLTESELGNYTFIGKSINYTKHRSLLCRTMDINSIKNKNGNQEIYYTDKDSMYGHIIPIHIII